MSLLALGFAAAGLLINAYGTYAGQKAENVRSKQEIKAAKEAASFDLSALLDQAYQMQQASDIEVFERQRQALRDRSRLLTAAGEANVGGNSTLRMVANNMWDTSYDIGISRTNLENQIFQNAQQARGVAATSQNRTNTALSRMMNPWLSAAIGIGAAAPAAYMTYQGIKKGGK